MGYRKVKTIYTLKYEDHPGLVVRAHSAPVGFLRRALHMGTLMGKDARDLTEQDVKSITSLFDGFAKHLLAWNLEDEDGAEVPATREGIDSQDVTFMFELIEGWMESTLGVDTPLGNGSNSGAPFPVASIPMEPLSPSQVS